MKKLTTLVCAGLLALGTQVHAAEDGAGCGLGAVVMKDQSGKGAHIAAAILNGLVIPNSFFMTTGGGIMGCDPTQVVEREEVTEIFVAQNMDQLSTDTAKGRGEYLNILATLMGVPESELPRFTDLAQAQFDALFIEGNDAASVIASLQVAMANDDILAPFALN